MYVVFVCLSVYLVLKLLYGVVIKTNVTPLLLIARSIRCYQQLKHILSLKTYINSAFLVKCKVNQKNAAFFSAHFA